MFWLQKCAQLHACRLFCVRPPWKMLTCIIKIYMSGIKVSQNDCIWFWQHDDRCVLLKLAPGKFFTELKNVADVSVGPVTQKWTLVLYNTTTFFGSTCMYKTRFYFVIVLTVGVLPDENITTTFACLPVSEDAWKFACLSIAVHTRYVEVTQYFSAVLLFSKLD